MADRPHPTSIAGGPYDARAWRPVYSGTKAFRTSTSRAVSGTPTITAGDFPKTRSPAPFHSGQLPAEGWNADAEEVRPMNRPC